MDNNTIQVFNFLKNHFSQSNDWISAPNIQIDGISTDVIVNSVQYLYDNDFINLHPKYRIAQVITGINL